MTFPHTLNLDHEALCAALAAGALPVTNQKIIVFDACLASI